jgi:hypothetical protein
MTPDKRPITPEEARTVALPSLLHPFRRIGRLAELAAGLEIEQIRDDSKRPLYLTRNELVVAAEEKAERDYTRALAQEESIIFFSTQNN